MGIKIGGQLEKVDGGALSYSDFMGNYVAKNQPVILTGLTDNWRACKDWVTENGNPNLKFIAEHFGSSRVQVSDCDVKEFADQKREEMTVSEFINVWLEIIKGDHCGIQHSKADRSPKYLKDWHFVKEHPDYTAYTTPLHFSDDWLNLYLDHYQMHTDEPYQQVNNEICCSDYRFVYMGVEGSWTPLHADVFRSFSWSANVCGRKQWFLLSPAQHHLILDRNQRNCVYNIIDEINETDFPYFEQCVWLECIQERNEVIFVPSGWYHQVHNLDDTISINHNWFNAYNLSWVWELLNEEYIEAMRYIEDVREICDNFEGLCQRNLAVNTGMNFKDLLTILWRFLLVNTCLIYCYTKQPETETGSSSNIFQQLTYNRDSIHATLLKMAGRVEGHEIFNTKATLEDPAFLKLCTDVAAVYAKVHGHPALGADKVNGFVHELMDSGSLICSAEGIFSFLDAAIVSSHGSLCVG